MLILTFAVALTTFFCICDAALYDVLSARVLQQQSYFRGVTALSNGDAVAVGYVNGAVGTTYGLSDFIIQRSTPNGTVVWTKQWGSASWDYAIYVVRDASDNIYVSGQVAGSFDGNTFYGGNLDCAVFKLDSAGNKLFSSQFGGEGNDAASAISIDTTRGFLFATGSTTTPENDTAFIAKLNLYSGVLLKYITLAPRGTYLFGSGTDGDGHLWVGGFTLAPSYHGLHGGGTLLQRFDADLNSTFVTLQGGAHSYHFGTDAEDNKYLSGLAGGDAFISRYNSAGVKVWSKQYGGSGDDGAMCSFADIATGRLYVTGGTQSPTFLGATNPNTKHNSFLLVLRISDGSLLYSSMYGTAGAHSGAMSVLTNGPYLYLSGASNGDFQGHAASTSAEHGFVLALSASEDESTIRSNALLYDL